MTRARAAGFLVALLCSTLIVTSADQERAEALVPAPALPILIPVVTAGAGLVVDGMQSGRLQEGWDQWVEVGSDVLRGFGSAFDWAFSDPEPAEVVWVPEPSTSIAGGCWAATAQPSDASTYTTHNNCSQDGTPTTHIGTGANKSDGLVWQLGNTAISYSLTLTNSPVVGSTAGPQFRLQWSGGVFPANGADSADYATRRVRHYCNDGTIRQWDFGAAANAVGTAAGTITQTLQGCPSAGAAGAIYFQSSWVNQFNSRQETGTYYYPNTAPNYGGPAPSYYWQTVRTCSDGSTKTEQSVAFKEADNPLPIFPDASCVGNALPLTVKVHQRYVSDNTIRRTVIDWTAPADWSNPDSLVRTQYSDCLPGGSAYPCEQRLLVLTPQGQRNCADTGVDCTDFDPQANPQQQKYECKWGPHTVANTQCRKPRTQTQPTPADPFPAPDSSDKGVLDCIGKVTLNPFSWVYMPMKCLLEYLFIPKGDPLGSLWSSIKTKFPFTYLDGGAGFVSALVGLGEVNGNPCPTVDFGFVAQGSADMFVRAPTPSGSGCAGAGGWAGNVGGYREVFRNILAGAVWAITLRKLATMVGPKADTATELA